MSLKTVNAIFFNGHFYDRDTKERILIQPEAEYVLVGHSQDFLTEDIFTQKPAHFHGEEEQRAKVLAEKDLHLYSRILFAGQKLYFFFGISKTDRKDEKWSYEFEVELKEDLYLYLRKGMQENTKPLCYDCACELKRETTKGLPFPVENMVGTSLNDIFQKVSQLYFGGKRSSSVNVFREFYLEQGARNLKLDRLREEAKYNFIK